MCGIHPYQKRLNYYLPEKTLWNYCIILLQRSIWQILKPVGEVENIKLLIAAATASIVPLLQGSGSRLKCIEAMALKTQLISTKHGAEGIEHKGSILIADKPADFQKQILRVLDDQVNNTGQAYEICKKHYSLEVIQSSLMNITRGLCKVSW